MRAGGWTEPLARGLDLDSAESAEVQRVLLRTKPSLRRVYERVYAKMLAAAHAYAPEARVRVELGSAGGFLSEIVPGIVTSDIRPIRGLDLVFAAEDAPFADASVDVVFAMHVIHHIPQIRRFFSELERAPTRRRTGCRGALLEPDGEAHVQAHAPRAVRRARSRVGVHERGCDVVEPSDELLDPRARPGRVPEREFPDLEVIRLGAFGGPSYLLTGGIWRRKLLPDPWLARLWDYEDAHTSWRRLLALHHIFVLRRAVDRTGRPAKPRH